MTEKKHLPLKKSTNLPSIRQRTFQLLDKNHILMPRMLCKLLDLPYKIYENTIKGYKSQWKGKYKNRQALKCLSFHNVRYWLYALKSMNRSAALGTGMWQQSKAKNRCFVLKHRDLGRLEWFETGRINIWIKKPASKGKMKQLLAYGFTWTGLIQDIEVFNLWASSAHLKGEHIVHDTGEELPYVKIGFLKDSLGVVVKTGDISHPTAVEIECVYPDWAERNERLLEGLNKLFGNGERKAGEKPPWMI